MELVLVRLRTSTERVPERDTPHPLLSDAVRRTISVGVEAFTPDGGCPSGLGAFGTGPGFCEASAMRLGFRPRLAMLVGILTGCLSPNPNLPVDDTESGENSTSRDTSGDDGATAGLATAMSGTSGPTTDSVTTETEDPSMDTGSPSCGLGSVCAPEVPAGWSGPVIRAESLGDGEAPVCPDTFPDLAFDAYADLEAAEAECDCECGNAVGASCATPTLEFHGGNSSCVGGAFDEFSIGASCQQGPAVSASNRWWSVDQAGVSGGSCTPSGSVDVPQASWASQTTACGGAAAEEPDECDGAATCVPEPEQGFEPALCVWQSGDLECPDGAYVDRFVRHADFTDTRNCEACECGDPEGDCVGDIRLWPTNNCSGGIASGTVPIGAGCVQAVDSVSSANSGILSVASVACAPSPTTAIGEAQPNGPYTLCCLSL